MAEEFTSLPVDIQKKMEQYRKELLAFDMKEPTKWDCEVIHYTCLSCNNDWVRGNYPFEEEEEE